MKLILSGISLSLLGAGRLIAFAILVSTALARTVLPAKSLITRDEPVVVGCFSSSEPLSNQGKYKYQSFGHCSGICTSRNQGVVGLSNGTTCWCGNELPVADTKVLDSKCSTPCDGYGIETCGGGTYYLTVWLTGLESNVQNYNPDEIASTSLASKTTVASPTSTTTTANDHQTTITPSTSESSDQPDTKSDKRIAIILGVVLSAVAIAIMALVIWWVRRRRKNTGSFFRGRSTPLLVGSSRPASSASSVPEATIYVSAGSKTWQGRISRTPVASNHLSKPNPGTSQTQDSNVDQSAEEDPFNLAEERVSASDFNYHEPVRHQHPPLLVPGHGIAGEVQASPAQELHHHNSSPQFQDQNTYQQLLGTANPFSSPHDDETDDVISPLDPPTKKLEKIRSLPLVHYPSWSEVSDFDFAGAGETKYERRSVDAWHPWRERRDGRYELA